MNEDKHREHVDHQHQTDLKTDMPNLKHALLKIRTEDDTPS